MFNLQLYLGGYNIPKVQVLKDKWDIDWCTFDEFYCFAVDLWHLNMECLKLHTVVAFVDFVIIQHKIIKEAPLGMKQIIKKDNNE